MKTYFPDDEVKQEMLEALIDNYNLLCYECSASPSYKFLCKGSHVPCIKKPKLKAIIEKATNEPIEEVLK